MSFFSSLANGFLVKTRLDLVHRARLLFLQRNVGQRRQRACKIRIDHHLAAGHSAARPFAADCASRAMPENAIARTITHSSSAGTGKEAVDECFRLARIRCDRAGNEAEIDAGILRLLEGLRMKQHAHGGRNMRVVRLGAIIVDPLLHHAERGARIDFLRGGSGEYRLDGQQECKEEGYATHVMLPKAPAGRIFRCAVAPFKQQARKHLGRHKDIFWMAAPPLASKLWRTLIFKASSLPARDIVSPLPRTLRWKLGKGVRDIEPSVTRVTRVLIALGLAGCLLSGMASAAAAGDDMPRAGENKSSDYEEKARAHDRRRRQQARRCRNRALLFPCLARRALR